MSAGMYRFFLYFAPGVTTLIFFNLPAGMQWLAFITGVWAAGQGTLLRSPTVRRWINIAPLPTNRRAYNAPTTNYKGTINTYRAPSEIAQSHTLSSRWKATRKTFDTYMQKQTKNKKTTRLTQTDLDKAKQYEKERRAEIDAARERYLNSRKR